MCERLDVLLPQGHDNSDVMRRAIAPVQSGGEPADKHVRCTDFIEAVEDEDIERG